MHAYLETTLILCTTWLSHVHLSVTPWTIARQALLSMGFSRQEYWSGLPFPTPRDLPAPAIKPGSLVPPALAGRFFTTEPPRKPWNHVTLILIHLPRMKRSFHWKPFKTLQTMGSPHAPTSPHTKTALDIAPKAVSWALFPLHNLMRCCSYCITEPSCLTRAYSISK